MHISDWSSDVCSSDLLVRFAALGCQRREDSVEHAGPAPADGTAVDRLVRTVPGRSTVLPQTVVDHEDDIADDPSIMHPRTTACERAIRFYSAHQRIRKPKNGRAQVCTPDTNAQIVVPLLREQ